MNGAFGTGKQQSFSFGVLAHRVGVLVGWNAVGYFRPGGAAVVSSINVRPQMVEPQSIDGCIGSVFIKMAGVENGNLLPGLELFWTHINPVCPSVSSSMNQAIVGPDPNQIYVERRRRDRIDHAALRWLRGRLRAKLADSL